MSRNRIKTIFTARVCGNSAENNALKMQELRGNNFSSILTSLWQKELPKDRKIIQNGT